MPVAPCGLCPLALQRGPLTPEDGRQVAQLVHAQPLPGKAPPPPGGRLPSGTQDPEENPAQSPREQEEARPGRKEGGMPHRRTRPVQTSGEMHRAALGSNSPATLLSQDGAQVAAPAARVWGTDQGQMAPAPPECLQRHRGTSAGADEQMSAGPAAHQRLLGQGELSGGAQSWHSRSGQLPGSHLRSPVSVGPPHSHLSPWLLFPASGTCQVPFQGQPPGNTQLAPCRQGHPGAPCRGGETGPG